MTASRDRIRQATVLLSAILALAGSFIGSGAAGGTPIQNASGGALAADATPIAPGGPAFAIWTPIYAGLVLNAIWQFLPRHQNDPRQRRLGYVIAASLLLNAAWILSVQADLLWLSVPVIVLLLAVLVRAFLITLDTRPRGLVEIVLVDGTLGLYLGWVCVATAANITALLVAAGFTGFGLPPSSWAVVIIALAGTVGLELAVIGRGRLAPTVALCWGLTWVAVARLTGDLLSTPTAVAALVAAFAVLATTVGYRLRAPRRSEPVPGAG